MEYRDSIVNAAYVPARRYSEDEEKKKDFGTDDGGGSSPSSQQCSKSKSLVTQFGYTMGAVILAIFICGVLGVIVGYIFYSSAINPLVREQRAKQALMRTKMNNLQESIEDLYKKAGDFDRTADVKKLYEDVEYQPSASNLELKPLRQSTIAPVSPEKVAVPVSQPPTQPPLPKVQCAHVDRNLSLKYATLDFHEFNNFYKEMKELPKEDFCTEIDKNVFIHAFKTFQTANKYSPSLLPYKLTDIQNKKVLYPGKSNLGFFDQITNLFTGDDSSETPFFLK